MAVILFSNNAESTVAAPIGNAATSVTIAPGSGALFPNPGANEYYIATFVDSATGLIREIVHVTAMSSDTATIVRAQEGTAAVSWNAGDIFSSFLTAGALDQMLQQGESQLQSGNFALDTGLVNTMVVTLAPAPLSLSALVGTPIRVQVSHTNTADVPTLNVNGLGAQPTAISAFGGPANPGIGTFNAGQVIELVWDGTRFQYNGLIMPATVTQIQVGAAVPNPITPAFLAAAMSSSHTGSGPAASGYQKFANGTIIQWGKFASPTGNADVITLPTTFPTAYTIASDVGSAGAVNLVNLETASLSQFVCYTRQWNGTTWITTSGLGVGWIAMGY